MKNKKHENINESIAEYFDSDEFCNWSQGKENLKKGFCVVYEDKAYPGKIIKQYPDGQKVFIGLDSK